MANDQRKFRIGQFSVDHVQIRAADGTGEHLKENLASSRLRDGPVAERERFSGLIENHRAHEFILANLRSTS
jgi:hypothetical protein